MNSGYRGFRRGILPKRAPEGPRAPLRICPCQSHLGHSRPRQTKPLVHIGIPSIGIRCPSAATQSGLPGDSKRTIWQQFQNAVQETAQSLEGLWQKFLPMATLFFLMAFVNTVLDNLKDTLIFTMAIGGGAQVVPWLTGLVPTMADANS